MLIAIEIRPANNASIKFPPKKSEKDAVAKKLLISSIIGLSYSV